MSVEQSKPEPSPDFDMWKEELEEGNPGLPIEVELLNNEPTSTPAQESLDAQTDQAKTARDKINDAYLEEKVQPKKISDRPGQTDTGFLPVPDHTDAISEKEEQWAKKNSKRTGLPKLFAEVTHEIARVLAPRRRL